MDITACIKKLLIREPFYGIFALGLNKYYSKDINTAGVCKNGINTELIVNQD